MPSPFLINENSDFRFFAILFIALSLLVVALFTAGSRTDKGDAVPAQNVSQSFSEVTLTAKGAYVYDARTKEVLFAKNENTRLPLASLTKLMAALTALEISPEYGTVIVSREAIAAEGDSGLKPDERWTLKDLLDFSLVSSSNDGIRAIALSLGALPLSQANSDEIINDFVSAMNNLALKLDLKNTYFWNETGLDESEVKGGAYGTAKDITALMEYVVSYHPELLEATRNTEATFTSLNNFNHVATNTNNLVGYIPGFLGSKTGFSATAGGNLTFAFDPELGRPIIITILGSTEQGRFEDAKKLIDATLSYINNQ